MHSWEQTRIFVNAILPLWLQFWWLWMGDWWVHPEHPLIARFVGPTWGPSGAGRTQVGPMLAPGTLLSGSLFRRQGSRWRCARRLPHLEDNRTTFTGVWSGSSKTPKKTIFHYIHVIMSTMVSQITSLIIVYSNVYLGVHQRKHQISASLAFVRGIHQGPVNSPHKGPVTRKMFPFDDVIMVIGISTVLDWWKLKQETSQSSIFVNDLINWFGELMLYDDLNLDQHCLI